MPSPVQQVIATAAPHDAVTDQALVVDGLLREWGHPGQVYAENVHPDLAGRVLPLSRRPPGDVVVLRYSIWSRAVEDVLARPPRRLVLVYHNVTPPELLARVNPRVAVLCARARDGLAGLAPRTALALADSDFNARDLRAAGFRDVRVVPLLLPAPAGAPPAAGGRGREILSVGRVVPNKRLELIVRAFALMRATGGDGELVLLGSSDGFEPYRAALGRFIDRLGVTGIRLPGRVGDAERDALMARAGVYVCASAHEGFCAPLVEAMRAGLPVVALRGSAVTETVGEGGLLLPGSDPSELAEAMRRVLDDRAAADLLSRAGRARAERFAVDRVAGELRAALSPALEAA